MAEDLVEAFSNKLGGDEYETSRQHPRICEFKQRIPSDQLSRRCDVLERQKKSRFDSANYARKLVEGELNEEEFDAAYMDVEYNKTEKRKEKKFNLYKNQLMLSEWLIDPPDDLESSWIMMLAPFGKRVLVVAHKGNTSAYSKNGYCLNRFPSQLPGGSFKTWKKSAKSSYTILDCIYDEVNKTFWILDLMCYKGFPLYENEMDFRMFWLNSKMAEDAPTIHELSPTNVFKFIACPYVPCLKDDMVNLIVDEHRFKIDGVLFYHRMCHYHPGRNPLVGWLKTYMIPLILNIPMPLVVMDDAPIEFNRAILNEANKKLQSTTKDKCFINVKLPQQQQESTMDS